MSQLVQTKEKTMTKTNQASTETSARGNDKPMPTHVAKVRHGWGKKATYERIGVLFTNDDGSFYLKLYGKQLVDTGVYLYKLEGNQDAAADEVAPVEDGGADEEAGE